jgi:hypothetical protein
VLLLLLLLLLQLQLLVVLAPPHPLVAPPTGLRQALHPRAHPLPAAAAAVGPVLLGLGTCRLVPRASLLAPWQTWAGTWPTQARWQQMSVASHRWQQRTAPARQLRSRRAGHLQHLLLLLPPPAAPHPPVRDDIPIQQAAGQHAYEANSVCVPCTPSHCPRCAGTAAGANIRHSLRCGTAGTQSMSQAGPAAAHMHAAHLASAPKLHMTAEQGIPDTQQQA